MTRRRKFVFDPRQGNLFDAPVSRAETPVIAAGLPAGRLLAEIIPSFRVRRGNLISTFLLRPPFPAAGETVERYQDGWRRFWHPWAVCVTCGGRSIEEVSLDAGRCHGCGATWSEADDSVPF